MAGGEILVDIETHHPRMVEEDLVAGQWVELLMDLAMVLDQSEGKALVETILMCVPGRETGFALILCKFNSFRLF